MNLVIDVGNTRIKTGVFEGDQLKNVTHWEDWNINSWEKWLEKWSIDRAILSSVAKTDVDWLQFFREKRSIIELDARTQLPFKNIYKTPETLGRDRLAAAAGAIQKFPATSCLIIDAGTCITMDFLDEEGAFHGGNISPGVVMRLNAMHYYTARLPKVAPGELEGFLGVSTEDALRKGGQLGAVLEIEGLVSRLRSINKEFNILLTGGDAEYLAGYLKTKIFVEPYLVLIGLNKILNYNGSDLA